MTSTSAAAKNKTRLSGRRIGDRRTTVIERRYHAPIADVWRMWTTKEGIEAWWGPDGFSVTVHSIDLRPGGEMFYAMRAVAPEMVAFMKREGMPTTTESAIVFDEVKPHTLLAYTHLVDFVPGIEAYDVGTRVELIADGAGTRLVLTLDAMHDDPWTERAAMGWRAELGKLEVALEEVNRLTGAKAARRTPRASAPKRA
jgi:uncharacterized protein YndB with AHSA1/START domain